MTLKVQELPMYERPYEKLELYGAELLSNSELLAIILGSGTKEETSIGLAQKILNLGSRFCDNELRFVQNVSIEELRKIRGIGRVKAIRLKAAFEISKRLSRPIKNEVIVNSSSDVAKIFMEELRYEKREIVKVVILNTKNIIIKIEDVSLGGTNYAVVEPKDILSSAVKMGSDKIILLHNHPSGNPTPSQEDYRVTKRIDFCANMLGIKLLDHIIIGDGTFKSILEDSRLLH